MGLLGTAEVEYCMGDEKEDFFRIILHEITIFKRIEYMCPTILLAVFNELNCYHTSTLVLYEFIAYWHILNAPLCMLYCDVSVLAACLKSDHQQSQ